MERSIPSLGIDRGRHSAPRQPFRWNEVVRQDRPGVKITYRGNLSETGSISRCGSRRGGREATWDKNARRVGRETFGAMKERKKNGSGGGGGGKREGERGLIAGREDGIMRCRFRDDAEGKRRAGAGDRQDDLLSGERRGRRWVTTSMEEKKIERIDRGADPSKRQFRNYERGTGSVGRPAGRNEIVSRFSSLTARGGITLP